VVVLDIDLTPELEAEGVARDLVRLVQKARRDAGLHVSDRIDLRLGVPESVRRQIAPFTQLISEPTLAVSMAFESGTPNAELDGEAVHIGVSPVMPPGAPQR
jgi:isoleucyl-tRNA synthetase